MAEKGKIQTGYRVSAYSAGVYTYSDRGGCDPYHHGSVPVFPQEEGRHRLESRYRHSPGLLLHTVPALCPDVCICRHHAGRACPLDTEYLICADNRFPVHQSSEIMTVKSEYPLNTARNRSTAACGIVTLLRVVQSENAEVPMLVTEFGMVILVKPLQPENA